MKKKLILLPILCCLLSSCGGSNPSDGKNNETSQQEVKQELTEEEKTAKINTGKANAKAKLDELVKPVSDEVDNVTLTELLDNFYALEVTYIDNLNDVDKAETATLKITQDFEQFVIQTLKPAVISELNKIANPIIASITINELKTSVQNYYNDRIADLNATTSAAEIVDFLNTLYGDVETFILSETGRLLIEFKNKALDKLEELVEPLIAKIPNEDLKQSILNFVNTEKVYLQSITELSEAKNACDKVVDDLSEFAISTFKPLLITKLNSVINPLIAQISYDELKNSVQSFYDNEIQTLNSVTSINDLVDAFSTIKTDFEEFVVSETERILTALKNEAINQLDPYLTALIKKIPYEELSDDLNSFYLDQKATLLAVTTFDDVPLCVENIKDSLEEFALEESKKIALNKLKEVVDDGLDRIPNEDLRDDLSSFSETEYAKINQISSLESVPTTLLTVTNETLNYIKSLLASTVKDYIDKLTQIESSTAYDYLPEAMAPSYSGNLVNESEIAYDFTNFTNVSDISRKGYGEQWQMVVDNINQSVELAKVFNVAQTSLNAATNMVKIYVDNTYAEEMSYEFSNDNVTGKFTYKDLVLTLDIFMTSSVDVPVIGSVKPVIQMKYNLLKEQKQMFVSLGDMYKLKYLISETEYEMATTYGVTIAGKTGSRSSYLGISIKDGITSGHIYEYTSLQDSDLIKACADFYVNNGFVSVVGNKASGMILFDGYVNELYLANEGRLIGYEVKEEKEIFITKIGFNTLWFNLWDISGLNNVKVLEKTKNNTSKRSTADVYLNNSDSLLAPTYNTFGSRKYDVELRSRFYYTYDAVNKKYVSHEIMVPMMFIQEGDNFDSFSTDVSKDNGLDLSVSLNTTYLNKILSDYDTLIDIFDSNKEIVTAELIKEYLK